MNDGIIDWLFGVLARPVGTLNEIARAKPVGWALLVYIGVTVSGSVVSFYSTQSYASAEQVMAEIGFLISMPVIIGLTIAFAFSSIFVATALLHLFARLFGGQGGYWNLFSAYAFASFPMIIAIPVSFAAGYLGLFGLILSGLASFSLSIWVIILQVLALRESHALTTGMSILTYIIQLAILVVVPVAIIIVLVFTFAFI